MSYGNNTDPEACRADDVAGLRLLRSTTSRPIKARAVRAVSQSPSKTHLPIGSGATASIGLGRVKTTDMYGSRTYRNTGIKCTLKKKCDASYPVYKTGSSFFSCPSTVSLATCSDAQFLDVPTNERITDSSDHYGRPVPQSRE